MAEVVLRARIDERGMTRYVEVDSAGTGDWHAGEEMDPRAAAVLEARGYDGTGHRARQIRPSWVTERDLLVAMDRSHLRALSKMDPAPGRLRLLMSFAAASPEREVPDPYYGDDGDFRRCLDMVELACSGVADHLAGRISGTSADGRGRRR